MQKVAVIQGLQSQIFELEVTPAHQRRTQALQVEVCKPLIKQLRGDPAFDELRKVLRISLLHRGLRQLFTQNLMADVVEQQSRRHIAIGRVRLDQGSRRKNQRFAHLAGRNTIVQILERRFENQVRPGFRQAIARRIKQILQTRDVQRNLVAGVVGDHQSAADHRCRAFLGPRALLRALLPIQHIGACDFMLP